MCVAFETRDASCVMKFNMLVTPKHLVILISYAEVESGQSMFNRPAKQHLNMKIATGIACPLPSGVCRQHSIEVIPVEKAKDGCYRLIANAQSRKMRHAQIRQSRAATIEGLKTGDAVEQILDARLFELPPLLGDKCVK